MRANEPTNKETNTKRETKLVALLIKRPDRTTWQALLSRHKLHAAAFASDAATRPPAPHRLNRQAIATKAGRTQ